MLLERQLKNLRRWSGEGKVEIIAKTVDFLQVFLLCPRFLLVLIQKEGDVQAAEPTCQEMPDVATKPTSSIPVGTSNCQDRTHTPSVLLPLSLRRISPSLLPYSTVPIFSSL